MILKGIGLTSSRLQEFCVARALPATSDLRISFELLFYAKRSEVPAEIRDLEKVRISFDDVTEIIHVEEQAQRITDERR